MKGYTGESSEYKFSDEKMGVRSIVTVSMDTSQRFILMGEYPKRRGSVVAHIDFPELTSSFRCGLSWSSLNIFFFDFLGVIDVEDPGYDDFNLWSPSEEGC